MPDTSEESQTAETQEPDASASPPAPPGEALTTDPADARSSDGSAETSGDDAPADALHDPDDDDIELSDIEARLLDDLDRLQAERNDYLDQLLRTRADFDNYRKRIQKQQSEHQERAAEALVEKLLEPLDTFELAVAHGQGFEQARDMLVAILTKEGMERIDPAGEAFDPNEADAVAHEDGDGGPVVSEVLRPGYRWKGRVIRPAMVKVRG